MFLKVKKFKAFLGDRVWFLAMMSVFVGVFLFINESSFILVLQGFMGAVGLVERSKLILPKWYPQSLESAVVILICSGILRSLAYALKFYFLGVTNQVFSKRMRSMVLDYGLQTAGETSTHEIIPIFTERVASSGIFLTGVCQVALTATSTVLLGLVGIKLAPVEMFLGLTLLGLFLFPLRILNSRYQSYGEGVVKEWETVSQALIQGLRNNFFLKIYGLIPQEVERGDRSLAMVENHYKKYYFVAAFKNAMPLIAGVVVISIITFVSLTYIKTPSMTLIAFFYLFVRISQGGSELSIAISELRLQYPSFKQLYGWYVKIMGERQFQEENKLEHNSVGEDGRSREFKDNGINISVEGLNFGYDDTELLFKNFDLRISRGDILLIKGESGVGKSTLLTLLLGLRSPTKGQVLVNGVCVSKVRDSLSQEIGYVGPEAYLVAGSVRENLLYGSDKSEQITDDEIWFALKRAQLHLEISSLSRKLDEPLYELTQLSTGQKQRLAIARALLRKPKLLILDEASANLDSATEKNFIGSLQEILVDLTTIIISHKSSFDNIATQKIELKR